MCLAPGSAMGTGVRALALLVGSLCAWEASAQTTTPADQAACIACHTQLVPSGASFHGGAKVACRECHVPATTAGKCQGAGGKAWTLARKPTQLCTGCHSSFEQAPSVHTAVMKGLCLECHQPHAAARKAMLRDEADALCPKCHAAKTIAPGDVKHQPAVDGRCSSCHDPHASKFPFQARMAPNELCASCHATEAKGPNAAQHRVDLAMPVRHPPAADCVGCHTPGHSSDEPALLEKSTTEACTRCHSVGGPGKRHAAIAKGGCVACHDAHGSQNAHLVKAASTEALCYGCHPRFEGKRIHAPVNAGACTSCHDPHSGFAEPLLAASREELCLSCHRQSELSQGPETHSAIRKGMCLACHDP